MTTLPPCGDAQSEATLSCLTGAIVLREGAGAVGSTFAREWEPDLRPPPPPPTPSSLLALPPLPTASARGSPGAPPPLWRLPRVPVPLVVRMAEPRRSQSRRDHDSVHGTPLPCGVVGAFALGATLAALAGLGLERGALEVAAVASAVAGGVTLAAALARVSGKGYADRRRE